MRAGEGDDIGAAAIRLDEAGRDLGGEDRVVDSFAFQRLLGEAGKTRRADQCDAVAGRVGLDQFAGVVARHGAGRGENRDHAAAGRCRGRLDRGHRADEGDGETRSQGRQNERRGGIAGDDDEIGMEARNEAFHHDEDSDDELVLAQPAIGKAGIVGGIDNMGAGAGLRRAPEHREAAEAGIEDEDGGPGPGDREGTVARAGEEVDLHESAAGRQSATPPETG